MKILSILSGNAALAAVVLLAAPFAKGADAIPDFAPNANTGWQLTDDEFIAPPSGPGPVRSDPAHPYISFYRFPTNPRPTFRVADLSNPILQQWTREALRKTNDKALSGKYLAIPKERCWPVGVPAFDLLPATPVYFLQTPKQVTMIWTQDHQVRHVFLNANHSAKPKPTWFGESVGHYEGDTLVVDTIGLSAKTFVDNYQTPHTEQLHVIERFHVIDGGKTLEVNLHVEDPGAFTTPWDAIQRYRRNEAGPMPETVCAENNQDHFDQDIGPMPIADKPDF
ncbi:MAG TPA: hypothetical protein VHT51_00115 [Micropepsaceae bacterium]|jgi:hypothetical protein|nr:hypothetical protein [Micropepsaceae bacterium]